MTGLYWLRVEFQFSCPEMKIDSEEKKSLTFLIQDENEYCCQNLPSSQ